MLMHPSKRIHESFEVAASQALRLLGHYREYRDKFPSSFGHSIMDFELVLDTYDDLITELDRIKKYIDREAATIEYKDRQYKERKKQKELCEKCPHSILNIGKDKEKGQ